MNTSKFCRLKYIAAAACAATTAGFYTKILYIPKEYDEQLGWVFSIFYCDILNFAISPYIELPKG